MANTSVAAEQRLHASMGKRGGKTRRYPALSNKPNAEAIIKRIQTDHYSLRRVAIQH